MIRNPQPLLFWAAAAALHGILVGCATTATPEAPKIGSVGGGRGIGQAPTANVSKLAAWRDAELLSSQSPGRSAAVGSGESMAPVYGDSTLLVIAPVAFADLEPGMTVAYQNRRGRRVVHQLLERTSAGWRVGGLNNGASDRERVTRDNLLGVVYASLHSDLPSP